MKTKSGAAALNHPSVARHLSSYEVSDQGCWQWTGGKPTPAGYARIGVKIGHRTELFLLHRLALEAAIGALPVGAHVDHVCHNKDLSCSGGPACLHRRCINPAHLESVSSFENSARSRLTRVTIFLSRDHCSKGHRYTPDNTYTRRSANGRTSRVCATCQRANVDAYRRRRAARISA